MLSTSKNWLHYLPELGVALNSRIIHASNLTPFALTYGFTRPGDRELVSQDLLISTPEEYAEKLTEIIKEHQKMHVAKRSEKNDRQRKYLNKNKRMIDISPDDHT